MKDKPKLSHGKEEYQVGSFDLNTKYLFFCKCQKHLHNAHLLHYGSGERSVTVWWWVSTAGFSKFQLLLLQGSNILSMLNLLNRVDAMKGSVSKPITNQSLWAIWFWSKSVFSTAVCCCSPVTIILYSQIWNSGVPLKAKTLPISNSRDPSNASVHTHMYSLSNLLRHVLALRYAKRASRGIQTPRKVSFQDIE